MNWKNITLEQGFIKQELNFKGAKAVNYIPINQIDSFGVVSSENKRWLYAGCFFLFCALILAVAKQTPFMLFTCLIGSGLIGVYLLTKQTWFNITSSQTKFSTRVRTTNEEIQSVNAFVFQIKQRIHTTELEESNQAA